MGNVYLYVFIHRVSVLAQMTAHMVSACSGAEQVTVEIQVTQTV